MHRVINANLLGALIYETEFVNWTTYSLCRDVYWDRNSEGRGSTIESFVLSRKIIRLPYTDFKEPTESSWSA